MIRTVPFQFVRNLSVTFRRLNSTCRVHRRRRTNHRRRVILPGGGHGGADRHGEVERKREDPLLCGRSTVRGRTSRLRLFAARRQNREFCRRVGNDLNGKRKYPPSSRCRKVTVRSQSSANGNFDLTSVAHNLPS